MVPSGVLTYAITCKAQLVCSHYQMQVCQHYSEPREPEGDATTALHNTTQHSTRDSHRPSLFTCALACRQVPSHSLLFLRLDVGTANALLGNPCARTQDMVGQDGHILPAAGSKASLIQVQHCHCCHLQARRSPALSSPSWLQHAILEPGCITKYGTSIADTPSHPYKLLSQVRQSVSA